jgi:TRAP-type C4-dicarboxylate transport system permease small subunit
VERWVLRTERAAGLFLGAIALITFVSVSLRGTLGFAIPDGFDVSRLMLAVAMFWGIASTGFRNEHIQVDVLWQVLSPAGRRRLDIAATAISLAFMAVFAAMLAQKVMSTWRSAEATFDIRLPVWPFHLLAALGIAFATLLLAIRLARLVRATEVE